MHQHCRLTNCVRFVINKGTTEIVLKIIRKKYIYILPIFREDFKIHLQNKMERGVEEINKSHISLQAFKSCCRSQWPRGRRRRSTAARLLGLWVRMLPAAWMSVVSVLCCCQVEFSATSWPLVQRSPTDCGASLCVI